MSDLATETRNRTDLSLRASNSKVIRHISDNEATRATMRVNYVFDEIVAFEKVFGSIRIKINRIQKDNDKLIVDITAWNNSKKVDIKNPVTIVNPRIVVGNGTFVTVVDEDGRAVRKEVKVEDPEKALYEQLKSLVIRRTK